MDKREFNVRMGKALAGCRVMNGYRKAVDFAPAVEAATGKKFSLSTLRRIEAGRQAMTVEQYAMCYQTLYGTPPKLLSPTRDGGGVFIDASI